MASSALRHKCGLSSIDFMHMRIDILNRLKALLPDDVIYHDISHTLNVEKAAVRFSKLEGIEAESILLLQTAALYHDAGSWCCAARPSPGSPGSSTSRSSPQAAAA